MKRSFDLPDLVDNQVHLGILGAIWMWCGVSKRPPGSRLYVNHNKDKEVTCLKCLERIGLKSPTPMIQRILQVERDNMRGENL